MKREVVLTLSQKKEKKKKGMPKTEKLRNSNINILRGTKILIPEIVQYVSLGYGWKTIIRRSLFLYKYFRMR